MRLALPADHDLTAIRALRKDILGSPLAVALERAKAYTRVFQQNEGAPWIVTKAMAFREHLRTVPLYVRPHDRIAGSLCEIPGGMPVMAEIGIAENAIFTDEDPHRRGYLKGKAPQDICDYWMDRNLWGRYRACVRTVDGKPQPWTEVTQYKFLSYQGHLSPSYRDLLAVGLGGLLQRVRKRRQGGVNPNCVAQASSPMSLTFRQECRLQPAETPKNGQPRGCTPECQRHWASRPDSSGRDACVTPDCLEFLTAAEQCLLGVSEWAKRYADFLAARDLKDMARIAAKVATEPPSTFREAIQLIWFVHQAIHIEGHGYSNTPDRLDQILYPFYVADKQAGRLTDDEALTLCENFILKMRDNTVWSVEHNLTQGICLSGSTPDGRDQTNELSWLFIKAADNMSLPEPLVWIRWHPNIDQDFFDFCLETLAGPTCFPLMMSDTAVPAMFMALGVSREDAFNYVAVGCNELAIPGQAYFNPNAHVGYLQALEQAITSGRGYKGQWPANSTLLPPCALSSFDDLVTVLRRLMRRQVEHSYAHEMGILAAQMRWGQTPFTSCFFDGCIDRGRDMIEGTKHNILSCGGTAFANMVDALAAIREVVYERKEATLEEVAKACAANFQGYESLRARLLAAAKHGNDDPRLKDIVQLVEQLRDEPVKEICRDPRDGTPFGNSHVVRSGAVLGGRHAPASPDGRLAGTPLASSVAASAGAEKNGPTALLNSILMLNAVKSWQSGYNVNMRFQREMLTDPSDRAKVRAMLNSYFQRGGQEMQINCVDTATLRAAQRNPDQYRDLVVRVAGFSEFFTKLDPSIQEDIIARAEHGG